MFIPVSVRVIILNNVLTAPGPTNEAANVNRRLSDADVAALRTYLGEADDLKPWLSTEILGYLLSGENETLLLRLPKLAGLAPSFTRMLPLPQPDGPYGDPLTLARNTLRDEARVRFLYGCESWDAAVFRRLGQVFVALDSRSTALSSARPPTQFSPAWFRALLEAFKSCRPAGRWPTRPVGVLDAERCLELLKLDAVGADAFIDVWFASQDSWGWNSSNIKVLPGLSGVLADAVEAMITGVRRLPPAAQVGALDWIAKEIGMTNPALMGEVIKLLRGNKQVAAAALAALRGADRMRLRASAEALLAAKDTQDRLIAVQLLGRIIGSEAEAHCGRGWRQRRFAPLGKRCGRRCWRWQPPIQTRQSSVLTTKPATGRLTATGSPCRPSLFLRKRRFLTFSLQQCS